MMNCKVFQNKTVVAYSITYSGIYPQGLWKPTETLAVTTSIVTVIRIEYLTISSRSVG
jgi:hypothetical protein